MSERDGQVREILSGRIKRILHAMEFAMIVQLMAQPEQSYSKGKSLEKEYE